MLSEYQKSRAAFIAAGRPLKKKEYKPISPISEKRKKKLQEQKVNDSDEGQWNWYLEIRKDMKGVCSHCGDKSCKDDDEKFHFSIAHILPKEFFPSIAKHPLNFIELCFWNNSCHTNFDNKILDIMDLNCFDEVITKFVAMYPMIAKEERKRIPQILLDYVEVEK